MLAVQLNAFRAAKLVDLETIGHLNLGALGEGRRAGKSEGDRIERRRACVRQCEAHLEMFAADDFRLEDAKLSVEDGLQKTLAPRSAGTQRPRGIDAKFRGVERAIGVNDAGQRIAVCARGGP